ncbi:c-type cytochrome [Sagittula sp. NFXS13]|uniref:c-type cytochrome n=1 Tax=Sagittula sp. NFXS13 TaxID=2819095 RepID=UPI0032DEDB68
MSKSLNLYAGSALGVGLTLMAAYTFADRNVADAPANPPVLAAAPAQLPGSHAPAQAAATGSTDQGGGLFIGAAHADTVTDGARFGLGREALPEEVAAWNVDVSPDGTGLPDGSGTAMEGEPLFEETCAACHGSFAEGVGNWPKLAGGDGTLADADPLKTVGSYWPYLSTVWDYVHRSMPFGNAQSLSDDEVYAIVAYILYSNDMIEDDFELSRDTWDQVEMENADGFIVDDRAEAEYAAWRTEPCMEGCKDTVEITMRATVLDVTPEEEGDTTATEAATEMTHSNDAATVKPEEESTQADTEVQEVAAEAPAAPDPELVAAGEKVFRKCKACHQVGEGAANRTGPVLNGVVGADIAGVEDFNYSGAMSSMEGNWTVEALSAFLAKPRDYVKGTKMAFAGLRKDDDIAAVIAYLQAQD